MNKKFMHMSCIISSLCINQLFSITLFELTYSSDLEKDFALTVKTADITIFNYDTKRIEQLKKEYAALQKNTLQKKREEVENYKKAYEQIKHFLPKEQKQKIEYKIQALENHYG